MDAGYDYYELDEEEPGSFTGVALRGILKRIHRDLVDTFLFPPILPYL